MQLSRPSNERYPRIDRHGRYNDDYFSRHKPLSPSYSHSLQSSPRRGHGRRMTHSASSTSSIPSLINEMHYPRSKREDYSYRNVNNTEKRNATTEDERLSTASRRDLVNQRLEELDDLPFDFGYQRRLTHDDDNDGDDDDSGQDGWDRQDSPDLPGGQSSIASQSRDAKSFRSGHYTHRQMDQDWPGGYHRASDGNDYHLESDHRRDHSRHSNDGKTQPLPEHSSSSRFKTSSARVHTPSTDIQSASSTKQLSCGTQTTAPLLTNQTMRTAAEEKCVGVQPKDLKATREVGISTLIICSGSLLAALLAHEIQNSMEPTDRMLPSVMDDELNFFMESHSFGRRFIIEYRFNRSEYASVVACSLCQEPLADDQVEQHTEQLRHKFLYLRSVIKQLWNEQKLGHVLNVVNFGDRDKELLKAVRRFIDNGGAEDGPVVRPACEMPRSVFKLPRLGATSSYGRPLPPPADDTAFLEGENAPLLALLDVLPPRFLLGLSLPLVEYRFVEPDLESLFICDECQLGPLQISGGDLKRHLISADHERAVRCSNRQRHSRCPARPAHELPAIKNWVGAYQPLTFVVNNSAGEQNIDDEVQPTGNNKSRNSFGNLEVICTSNGDDGTTGRKVVVPRNEISPPSIDDVPVSTSPSTTFIISTNNGNTGLIYDDGRNLRGRSRFQRSPSLRSRHPLRYTRSRSRRRSRSTSRRHNRSRSRRHSRSGSRRRSRSRKRTRSGSKRHERIYRRSTSRDRLRKRSTSREHIRPVRATLTKRDNSISGLRARKAAAVARATSKEMSNTSTLSVNHPSQSNNQPDSLVGQDLGGQDELIIIDDVDAQPSVTGSFDDKTPCPEKSSTTTVSQSQDENSHVEDANYTTITLPGKHKTTDLTTQSKRTKTLTPPPMELTSSALPLSILASNDDQPPNCGQLSNDGQSPSDDRNDDGSPDPASSSQPRLPPSMLDPDTIPTTWLLVDEDDDESDAAALVKQTETGSVSVVSSQQLKTGRPTLSQAETPPPCMKPSTTNPVAPPSSNMPLLQNQYLLDGSDVDSYMNG